MLPIVVTAAGELEPGTAFLVNAMVSKNVTSADFNNKNDDFN